MDIGSEQAQLAYLGAAGGVAACLAGARVPVVWPRVWPGRGYRRGVAACASGRGARVLAVWPCVWPGRPGSSWRREVVGARGGVGTADAREAVVTTSVGRGGGGVLGVAGRVAWAQGERNR